MGSVTAPEKLDDLRTKRENGNFLRFLWDPFFWFPAPKGGDNIVPLFPKKGDKE